MNLTAKQLYVMAIGHRLAGTRATVQRDVTREPHFTVSAGSTGVMLDPLVSEDQRVFLRLLLDDPPEGAQQFDGECHWIEGSHFPDFEQDLLFQNKPAADML